MTIQSWFTSKPLWLRGGMIGVVICILLFPFYLFLYFPIIDAIYPDQISTSGSTPAWTLLPSTISGHFLPLFSHFLVESSGIVEVVCEATEPGCSSWVSEDIAREEGYSCIPWKSEVEGTNGCCTLPSVAPSASCSETVEAAGFWVLALLLAGVYFLIGSAIGWYWQQRKQERTTS